MPAEKKDTDLLALHPQDIVELFEKFSIMEPSRRGQIEGTLKQINEKIEYYKGLAPPADKVLKARLYGENFDDEDESPRENVSFTHMT